MRFFRTTIPIIILLCISKASLSQTIEVKLNDNKVELSGIGANKIVLPLTFLFDTSAFKGKEIKFFSGTDKTTPLARGTFHIHISKPGEGRYYKIKLNEESILDFDKKKQKINSGTLSIQVGDSDLSPEINFIQKKKETNKSESKDSDQETDKKISYTAGSMVADALKLSTMTGADTLSKSQKKISQLIFRAYNIEKVDFDNNLFLIEALQNDFWDSINTISTITDIQVGAKNLITSAASSVGSMDVTTIADGFAKFVVKRTKEELSITFFKRFKERLDSFPDLKTVFPATSNILMAIDSDVYNYSSYINNLRESFRSDLLVLDENIPGIFDNHTELFKKPIYREFELGVKTGCFVSVSLRHDMHPGDILEAYPLSYFKDTDTAEYLRYFKGSIQSLQLFSESMRESDTAKHTYWVGMDKIRQLASDPMALKIYIGLMLQVAKTKYNNIPYPKNTSFYSLVNDQNRLNAFNANYPQFKQYILTFGSRLNELNLMIRDHQEPGNDSAKVELYASYFKAAIQLLHHSVKIAELPLLPEIPGLKNLNKSSEKYFKLSNEAAELTIAITRKQYPQIVNHLLVIYNLAITQPSIANTAGRSMPSKISKKEKKDIAEMLIVLYKKDPDAKVSLSDLFPKITDAILVENARKTKVVLADIAKYGVFMANLINAENSDEVANAIEAAALPTGSARVKRESNFNVSINTYPGLFIGNEDIQGFDDDASLNVFGLSVPVGFSISKGKRILPIPLSELGHKYIKAGWSSSWFISLVDIGAVAAFRFKDSQTAQVPTIQLKDIFSPGVFYSLGIPETPISFNLGVQVGPNLRKVEVSGNDYSNNLYIRYSASLCVDIPVFNLFTR